MLAELNPKPDQVTIVIGTTQMNILDLTTPDDVQGTHLANPAMQAAYQNMVADATPEFYIEHLKRLRQQRDPADVRHGPHPHPRSDRASHPHRRVHGAVESHHDGHRRGRRLWPQSVRLHGVGASLAPGLHCDVRVAVADGAPYAAMAVALGIHIRVGNEDNLWRQAGPAHDLGGAGGAGGTHRERAGRKVATADEARQMLKIGTWYNSPDETLANLGLPPNRKDGQLGFIVKEPTDDSIRRSVHLIHTPSRGSSRQGNADLASHAGEGGFAAASSMAV